MTPEEKPSMRSRVAPVLGAALLASTNLCLFGVLEIFQSNRGEFDATLGEVLPLLIAVSLALTAVLTVVGLAIPRRIRTGFVSVVMAGGLLLWIQGSFLRWNYGEFDGSGIDWASYPWQGWVDATIWVVVCVVAVRFRETFSRYAWFAALAFIFIGSGSQIVRSLSAPQEISDVPEETKKPDVVPQAMCQISRSRNIFHIIMDSFQSDVFVELARENGWAEVLDGFFVYPEDISTGDRTVLAVPSIFSSNVYDGSQAESDYFQEAMAGSFHYLLYNNGYIVNLLPHIDMSRTVYSNHFMRPIVYAQPHRQRVRHATAYLLDVGMFRQFPHFAKKLVYNNQNWRLSSTTATAGGHVSFYQKRFFTDYINRLESVHDEPAYHFIHLMPPHKPLVTLADGTYSGKTLPFNRENYKNEARAIFKLFIEFLNKLKQLGVYDNSVILLHGDHGAGLPPVIAGRKTTNLMGKLSALLLVKPFSANGPLRFSPAQTSLTDIPATVLDLAGIPHPYPGESVLKRDPSETPARRLVFVTDRASPQPTVNRWIVQGSVFDEASWHELEPVKVQKEISSYVWGTGVGFGITGKGDKYLTHGWTTSSPTLHMSSGESAEMVLAVPKVRSDIKVELKYWAIPPDDENVEAFFNLAVNGHPLGHVLVKNKGFEGITVVVPEEWLPDRRMAFSFEFPGGENRAKIGLYWFACGP